MPDTPVKGRKRGRQRRPEAKVEVKEPTVYIAGKSLRVLGPAAFDSISYVLGDSGFKFSDPPEDAVAVSGFHFVTSNGKRKPMRISRISTWSETVLKRMLDNPKSTEHRASAAHRYCRARRLSAFGRLKDFVQKHGPMMTKSRTLVYMDKDGMVMRSSCLPGDEFRARNTTSGVLNRLGRLIASTELWLALLHSMSDMQLFAAEFALREVLRKLPREGRSIFNTREGPAIMKINGRLYVYHHPNHSWELCDNIVDIDAAEAPQ